MVRRLRGVCRCSAAANSMSDSRFALEQPGRGWPSTSSVTGGARSSRMSWRHFQGVRLAQLTSAASSQPRMGGCAEHAGELGHETVQVGLETGHECAFGSAELRHTLEKTRGLLALSTGPRFESAGRSLTERAFPRAAHRRLEL